MDARQRVTRVLLAAVAVCLAQWILTATVTDASRWRAPRGTASRMAAGSARRPDPVRQGGARATAVRRLSRALARARALRGPAGPRIVALHLKHTAQKGDPMRPVLSARVNIDTTATGVIGHGLRGDRNAKAARARRTDPADPRFNPDYLSKRQVTLLDISELAAIEGLVDAHLTAGDMREQITTAGLPDLTALPAGTRIEVGGATLEITGATEPCNVIGQYLDAAEPTVLKERLIGVRGVLTRVVARRGSGRLLVGDRLRITPPSTPPPSPAPN